MRKIYIDLLSGPPHRQEPREDRRVAGRLSGEERGDPPATGPALPKKGKKRLVPLSELADHFAHSQLYPWHLESACEWLGTKGGASGNSRRLSESPKMSRVEVEEPAYLCEEE